MLIYIVIALAVQLFGVYRAMKVRNDYQAFSAILTVTSSVCIGILTFPYFLLFGDDMFITILHTFKYGISSVGLSVDGDIVAALDLKGVEKIIYTLYLYSLYLIGPVSASIFIVSFSRSIVRFFRMLGYKRVHVFSTLDERSLAIYESIVETGEKQVAVFCSCSNA